MTSLASGVLQALTKAASDRQTGYSSSAAPVTAMKTHLLNGDLVGTGIQPLYLEGRMTLQNLVKYPNAKKSSRARAIFARRSGGYAERRGRAANTTSCQTPAWSADQKHALQGDLWGKPLAGLCRLLIEVRAAGYHPAAIQGQLPGDCPDRAPNALPHNPTSEPDNGTVLRAIDISKSYGGFKALDQIAFELQRGEVHGSAGENGAGKVR